MSEPVGTPQDIVTHADWLKQNAKMLGLFASVAMETDHDNSPINTFTLVNVGAGTSLLRRQQVARALRKLADSIEAEQ